MMCCASRCGSPRCAPGPRPVQSGSVRTPVGRDEDVHAALACVPGRGAWARVGAGAGAGVRAHGVSSRWPSSEQASITSASATDSTAPTSVGVGKNSAEPSEDEVAEPAQADQRR